MESNTKSGFSPIVIIGIVGVMIVLVGGGIYAKQNFTGKKIVEETKEIEQATSTIALSPLINAQNQVAPKATNSTSAQGVKKETASAISDEDIKAAIKRFLEYKVEADKIVSWQTYKTVFLKYGYRYAQEDLSKVIDFQWKSAYDAGRFDERPKFAAVSIIKGEPMKLIGEEYGVRIVMAEKNTTRQGYAVLVYREGVWKVSGEVWPSK